MKAGRGVEWILALRVGFGLLIHKLSCSQSLDLNNAKEIMLKSLKVMG